MLVDFDKSHSPTETIILNQNYRSTPQILRCANHLIEKNELRLKKDLFTNSPNGSIVTHIHSRSDEDENNSIVSNIKQLMKTRGFSYSDFAILYRSGFMSRVIEKKFVEDNIPYEIYGGVKFYQRMEILDIVAYLKLIAYDDDMSFKRIVNKPHRTFGRAKIAHLDYLRENVVSLFDSDGGNSYYQTLKNNLYDSYFGSSGAKEFVDFIENMRKFAKTARVSEIVNRVTEESGYEQYIRELGSEERLDNLAEFKRISNEFEHSFGEKLTLDEFLQQIALQSGEDEEKPRVAVKLMTIHAAKGLEFPVVFIVGMTEGIFPSSKTIEERKKLGLEEERRLCYVAITRAKEYLFIMDSEGVSEKGMRKLPSRFLFEIGEANYIRVGNISEGLMHESFKYIKRNTPIDPQPELKVGARVDHYMFGHGTIVGVDNSRLSYTIKFDNLPQTRNISKMYFDKKHDVPDTTPEHSSDEPVSNNVVEEVESDLTPEGDKTVYHEEIDDEFSEYDEGVEYELEDNALDSFEYEEVERFTREEIIEPKSVEKFTEKPLNQTIFEPSDSDGSLKRQAHTISDDLRKRMAESDNLWNRDDVPHSGWTCNGVTDLGEPCGICEICGNQIIRYVHHMTHPQYHPLDVGCICAGKMEGDIEAAKRREQDFKNRESRRENFKKRKWKESRNGNSYAKIKEHIVVLYKLKNNTGWKYSLDNEFCVEVFNSKEEAIEAAFEALEKVINPLS